MNIKVRDLKQTETIENNNKLMVLVNDNFNLVKNINKEDFVTNLISSAADNALEQAVDGSLYVNTSEIADDLAALSDDLAALSDEVDTIETNIGDLSNLTTEDKTNLVAAINETANSGGGGTSRNVGEIVASSSPLTDAGLHLLDGALIDGDGIYKEFVEHMAGLYTVTEAEWQQPYLTSNGTMGGVQYACSANSVEGSLDAFNAFDNDSTTRWGSGSDAVPDWLTFYSPIPLKVSSVYLDFFSANETYKAGEIQGSNDNINWDILTTFSNNSSQTITLPITTSNRYKYIRFYATALSTTSWGKVANFKISATYEKTPNYFCTESEWLASVTQYGVCGKFVYDSVNNTVRLPKITGKIDGTTDINFVYIVVATSTKTDIQVNLDNVATEINNMVSKDDLQEVQCVVETYQNGTSWYRIWSDGWCEQGGRVTSSGSGRFTINFLKKLKDSTMFYPTLQIIDSTTLENHVTGSYVYSHTKSSMVCGTAYFRTGTPSYISVPLIWKIEGYIEV